MTIKPSRDLMQASTPADRGSPAGPASKHAAAHLAVWNAEGGAASAPADRLNAARVGRTRKASRINHLSVKGSGTTSKRAFRRFLLSRKLPLSAGRESRTFKQASEMKRLSLHYALRAVLTVALAGVVVQVAASQPVDHPWTGTGTGTTTVVSDGTSGPAVFSYSQTGVNGSWKFSTVAGSTRVVHLAWTYSGFHSFFRVRVGLDAFVTHGTTTTTTPLVNAGPADCCTPPSAGFTYSGTTSLSVQAADTYGFAMRGSNVDTARTLRGTLTVDKAGVTDVTPPTASCDLGVNPSGKGKPNANAGFRQVNASDNGSGLTSLVITDGTFTSGQLRSGDYLKLTVAPGEAGSDVRPGPGVLAGKITTSGQPLLEASDAAGNTTTVPCGPLPPNGR